MTRKEYTNQHGSTGQNPLADQAGILADLTILVAETAGARTSPFSPMQSDFGFAVWI